MLTSNRQIEIQYITNTNHQMLVKRVISKVPVRLKLEGKIKIDELVLNDDLEIESDCVAGVIVLNGNSLTVDGNLKLMDSMAFEKGQVLVKGSMNLFSASRLTMKEREDLIKIDGDLEMSYCMNLNLKVGQLILGGNIQKVGSNSFETGVDFNVILLGKDRTKITVTGRKMILRKVYLENKEAQYEFGEGVYYSIA